MANTFLIICIAVLFLTKIGYSFNDLDYEEPVCCCDIFVISQSP